MTDQSHTEKAAIWLSRAEATYHEARENVPVDGPGFAIAAGLIALVHQVESDNEELAPAVRLRGHATSTEARRGVEAFVAAGGDR